jgi:hypothetical protein
VTASVREQVRQAIDEARAAGEQPPGRPTLMKLTGATDHQVRVALAELATPAREELATLASEGTAATNGHRTADRLDDDREDRQPPAAAAGTPNETELASAGEPGTSAGDSPVTGANRGGKLVAWCGFTFGSIVSVAANVLAARIAPKNSPVDWKPALDTQVGAAVWPIALLLSVEVLSRIKWPTGKGWGFARYGGVGLVAAGSAVISYQHIRDVLVSWGYPMLSAGVGPLVVDGLMIASGFAMLAMARASKTPAGGDGGEQP